MTDDGGQRTEGRNQISKIKKQNDKSKIKNGWVGGGNKCGGDGGQSFMIYEL
jgi:hypothetical protein